MKIKLFSRTSKEELEQAVNQFIQDKNVVDIKKYQSYSIVKKYNGNGVPIEYACVDHVLVIYKEDKIDVL